LWLRSWYRLLSLHNDGQAEGQHGKNVFHVFQIVLYLNDVIQS
jgi:hypothetical protein